MTSKFASTFLAPLARTLLKLTLKETVAALTDLALEDLSLAAAIAAGLIAVPVAAAAAVVIWRRRTDARSKSQ